MSCFLFDSNILTLIIPGSSPSVDDPALIETLVQKSEEREKMKQSHICAVDKNITEARVINDTHILRIIRGHNCALEHRALINHILFTSYSPLIKHATL